MSARTPHREVPARKRTTTSIWALVISVSQLASCGSEPDPGSENPDRGSVFRQLGNEVIAPTLEKFATEAKNLETAAQAFCDAPNESQLAAAQQAWRSTREPWSLAEPAGFGPIDGIGVANSLNFWPARPENIESALNLHNSFDPVTVNQLGASAKGMPAIEYLLFGD
ncbi:MAG: imelysin family protein, partial [Nannocystaceae bacterium]